MHNIKIIIKTVIILLLLIILLQIISNNKNNIKGKYKKDFFNAFYIDIYSYNYILIIRFP